MDPNLLDAAWHWTWPGLVILGWVIVSIWLNRRFFKWFAARIADDPRVGGEQVRQLSRLTLFGLLVAGVYVWAWLSPMPLAVDEFLRHAVEPWFWYTLGLIAWVVGGTYVTRKTVTHLAHRAAATHTAVDDALTAAVRRPLHLGILIIGVNLWAVAVPMPAEATPYLVMGTKTSLVVLAVLFLDTFVHTWTKLREATSSVLRTSGTVLRAAARGVLYILGILVIASTVDINVTPIITTLGIGSLAIGLALQKTLEDFLAGLLIAADQPIRVGDFVELETGDAGTVLSIGWRTVRMRRRDDTYVVVPNSRLAQASVVNRSMPTEEVGFTVPVGVHYDTDLDRASDIALQVAQLLHAEDPRAVLGHRPRLVYSAFGESAIEFVIWLRARSWEDHFGLKDAFIRALHARFLEAEIVIPFPIRTLDVPEGVVITARLEALASEPATGAGVA